MKQRLKKVIAWLLILVLAAGCMPGNGMMVMAADPETNEVGNTGEENQLAVIKEELKALIDSVETMDSSLYTPDSWETLSFALENAKEVYEKYPIENRIIAAKRGLKSAVSLLIKKLSVLTLNVVDQNQELVTDSNLKLSITGEPNPIVLTNGILEYTFPKLDTEKQYQISVSAESYDYTAEPIMVTVNADREITKIGEADYDGKPVIMNVFNSGLKANITDVTATPTMIGAEGGSVTIAVTGTNVTANNWGIQVERYISETESPVSDSAGKAEIKEITADGAVVEITGNGMKNAVDFVFTVGSKSGDSITPQKTVKVIQEGKNYETMTLNQPEVLLEDDNTIVAKFDTEIFAAKSGDALKNLFYVVDTEKIDGVTTGNTITRKLSENDTVTVKDQVVKLTFENAIELTSQAKLCIKEGALKVQKRDSNGKLVEKVARDIEQLINSTPKISFILLNRNILDKKGGEVIASLEGYKVADIPDEDIEARLYFAGETESSNIEIAKGRTAEGVPTLIFTVPENTTDHTESYWLSVKVSGTPVYEGASMNRAQRATVSVLPEGKTDKDRTLSMLTISGNNKVEKDSVKNITVNVASAVGELKTELRLYGTNLDEKVTKVRAIDQNGIVWPVYDIPECDGTIRFVAIAGMNKNGVFGNGNTQLIEVLPPRYVGPNMTYTLQVAIDGVNYIDVPNVTLTVNNANLVNDGEFYPTGKDDIRTVTVKYIDTDTKKEIAKAEVFKGYPVSMFRGFDIKAKTIAGYKLVKEPVISNTATIGSKDRTFTYEYKSTTVKPQPSAVKVKSIKLSGTSTKIAAGKKIKLKATVSPSNAKDKSLKWTSSNTKYASVSSGTVTLKKAGAGKKVTITAAAKDGSGKKATYKITIMKHAVKSISLKSVKYVKAGKNAKVNATVKTTGKDANKKISWTTSNSKYATVTSSGVVKTKKAGKGKTVKITAKSTDGTNKSASVKIKIK